MSPHLANEILKQSGIVESILTRHRWQLRNRNRQPPIGRIHSSRWQVLGSTWKIALAFWPSAPLPVDNAATRHTGAAPWHAQLKVAVQMDPIEHINIDADSSFALMLEAQRRGHSLWHYEVRHLALREGVKRQGERREDRLFARARPVTVERKRGAHYAFGDLAQLDLATMDVVLMRQDPPFDAWPTSPPRIYWNISIRRRWW